MSIFMRRYSPAVATTPGRLTEPAGLAAVVMLAALLLASVNVRALSFGEAIGNNGLDIFPNQPGDPFNFVGANNGTLTLDPGINEFLGFFSCFDFGCTDDFDSFRMIVPDGLEVVRTTLYVVNPDGTSEQLDVYPLGVFTTPPRFDEDWRATYRPLELRLVTGIIAGPGTSTTVLAAGTYDVVPFNFAWIGGGGWRAEFETAAVSAVPVPASGVLLGSGLAACARLRRRARR